MTNRLGLGTVQLGLPYGIASGGRQVDMESARAIVTCAYENGLTTLDTAIGYGESESRLGEIGVSQFKVVTKLPAIPRSCQDISAWVTEAVGASRQRLQISRLYGLLLHHPQDLAGPDGDALYRALVGVRANGLVGKIGVSVYGPDELDAVCSRGDFDIVQAPFNIVDRRLETSGWLARLGRAHTEIHVRSVFLQGLLLMTPDKRPAIFGSRRSLWERWDRWLQEASVKPLEACLGFALSRPEIDRVIVGVDSVRQLREILSSAAVPISQPPNDLSSEDMDLINPSRWHAK
jgi:aryl-alcohol dehydrogenase-like predicted oxidoreductase